ncbi:MAG: hypothetical protein U0835_15140 [Isosphaeraceae bacterium]
MNTDLVHAQRLQSLDIWHAPVEIEPLSGGITNHNYKVVAGGVAYVARLSVERPLLGIDRRNEVVCQRAAHALGVAPEVVHHEGGVLVSAYIKSRTLTVEGGATPRSSRGWQRCSAPCTAAGTPSRVKCSTSRSSRPCRPTRARPAS